MKNSIEQLVEDFEPKLNSFPWQDKMAYTWFCAQTYYYVTHTPKLLQYAADRAEAGLKEFLLHHLQEEKGHDLWASGDVKALGHDVSEFSELESTKALYQSAYKAIDRHGPIAIFGYGFPLEFAAAKACPSLAVELEKLYGKRACTFIRMHGIVDQEHSQETPQFLSTLKSKEVEIIESMYEPTLMSYLAFLEGAKRAAWRQAAA